MTIPSRIFRYRGKLRFAFALLLALMLYGMVYRRLVDPVPYGDTGPAVVFPYDDREVTVVRMVAGYGYPADSTRHRIAAAFFAPAHGVDRLLRPRVWDPRNHGPIHAF